MSITDTIEIGKISNYYGGILVKHIDDKYYWTIENYDFNATSMWIIDGKLYKAAQEIPKELYDMLIVFDR